MARGDRRVLANSSGTNPSLDNVPCWGNGLQNGSPLSRMKSRFCAGLRCGFYGPVGLAFRCLSRKHSIQEKKRADERHGNRS